jgi:hypothetical protein
VGVSPCIVDVEMKPFCSTPYGCAFDVFMTDPNAVYIKIDDDIVLSTTWAVRGLL